jgi:hypothetical protein
MALEQLHAFRAGEPLEGLGPVQRLEPEGFPLLASSELAHEHGQLGPFIAPLTRRGLRQQNDAIGDELLAGDAAARTRMYLAVIERIFAYDARLTTDTAYTYSNFFDYGGAADLMARLLDAGAIAGDVIVPTLDWFTTYRFVYYGVPPLTRVLELAARDAASGRLAPDLRDKLIAVHGQCRDLGGYHQMAGQLGTQLEAILGHGAWEVLAPCEVWSATVTRELEALPASERDRFMELLRHCAGASASRPSDKWLKTGRAKLDAIGRDNFRRALLRWFPLVDRGRPHPLVGPNWDNVDDQQRMHEANATLLRGLVWLSAEVADTELTRAIGKLVVSSYRKVRGLGPRAPKVGNAGVYALSRIGTADAVGQLALVKARVRTVSALKEIEKAFVAAAEALGLPRDQVEEMSVPTYGMDEVGRLRETFAAEGAIAEIRVDGRDAALHWMRSDGTSQKSVPAKVKSDQREALKELQGAVKDIGAMLPAQSERLDSMFLLEKRWPLAGWREHYLDHALVGTIARRLIWTFQAGGQREVSAFWRDGGFVDAESRGFTPADDTQVRLWHPIGCGPAEVVAWRGFLEQHGVRQPFKQAHREVYLLTDAERATETYSNRFAAHVLRQHQFNALCGARGWRSKLRMMVDDAYPPAYRELPHWGLRAEYWIEGIGTEYGTDTNDSGAYLRVATDQVRFYRLPAAPNSAHAGGGGYTTHAAGPGTDDINLPVPLEQIPALVFSEVMRDVDLFVGVGSVGNDPGWQDGGPGGRFLTYWQAYSFGELAETAKTRRAVLERLVPRLKIADRCSFSDRFLVVRGDLRTYKIHLGSGNILMKPNDQYLCIVPARQVAPADGKVFLPFEGDSTLALILSKALLLAADRKITDPTIVQQIGSGGG